MSELSRSKSPDLSRSAFCWRRQKNRTSPGWEEGSGFIARPILDFFSFVEVTIVPFRHHTISLICLDHWLEANATWHRHPADVLSPFIWQRWYKNTPGDMGVHAARQERTPGGVRGIRCG